MSDAVTLVNSVGFPIAAFLLMFWQNVTVIKANTQAMVDMKDAFISAKEGK